MEVCAEAVYTGLYGVLGTHAHKLGFVCICVCVLVLFSHADHDFAEALSSRKANIICFVLGVLWKFRPKDCLLLELTLSKMMV